MEQLIKVTTNDDGNNVVSLRELYKGLGLQRTNIGKWCNSNIVNSDFFFENQDWWRLNVNISGNETTDFEVTLDFAKYIINSAKSTTSDVKIGILKQLNMISDNDIISKPEIEFKSMLERFLSRWNITIEQQFKILNYRIDFLINGYIAVEYDECHHDYISEYDEKRMEEINNFIYDKSGGDFELKWIRIRQGKSIEGLAEILDVLVGLEDLSSFDQKTKVHKWSSKTSMPYLFNDF